MPSPPWIWKLGPWLLVLFGEVMERLGGGVLPEEVHHCGWALRAYYSLAPLLGHTLCFLWMVGDIISQLPVVTAHCHTFPAVINAPSATVSQDKLCLPSVPSGHGI